MHRYITRLNEVGSIDLLPDMDDETRVGYGESKGDRGRFPVVFFLPSLTAAIHDHKALDFLFSCSRG